MLTLEVRNVHEALPRALRLLNGIGIVRSSRNGDVLMAPCPITTVYHKPVERVLFWPQRDANPFFHLYESLWMLAGQNDIASVARYAKQMEAYSDDGETLHGAYGYRWRKMWGDQLRIIAEALIRNPEDRRNVLQMWNTDDDLARDGKDLPCNLTATFQRDANGALDLTVFCRSNDIIWGCYGANAVHFSMLLEYMAHWIGCEVGVYRQISVNWHAYIEKLTPFNGFVSSVIDRVDFIANPYVDAVQDWVRPMPMKSVGDHDRLDDLIYALLDDADGEFEAEPPAEGWANVVYHMLKAHYHYRTTDGASMKYALPLEILDSCPVQNNDWITAGRQWFQRRLEKNLAKVGV